MLVSPESFKPHNPNGFIVFDGVNGAGKSTQLKRLARYFEERGIAVQQTREPGATTLGKTIRSFFTQKANYSISSIAETFLFAADRAQHVSEVIKPCIAQKTAVLCDRFYYSTIAFQGYGRQQDLATIKNINTIAIQSVLPDLVFLFDLDPAIGLKRAAQRNDPEVDTFEQEELAFHSRLRNGFLTLAETLAEPFVRIDASQDEEAVWQQILPFVEKYLQLWPN